MLNLEELLLGLSTLILASIFIARISNNLGVPVLLLFLGVGMLAGSQGPGGIAFEDYALAQSIGITALVFILFSGGLSTHWKIVKPVLLPSLSLATVGVLITAVSIALFIVCALCISCILIDQFTIGIYCGFNRRGSSVLYYRCTQHKDQRQYNAFT
ncbi:cation:proton antiporter [Cytophaga aurantiaca]|uniref:cation:proton antiporter domain-containing protein n=1 Tax=Cytophaga aurantiaca TaxID=29530 RepID=UPI00039DACCA|nr:cation:proton antiporter [Cytophaga aurantiaca]